jgi:hypothetical protein
MIAAFGTEPTVSAVTDAQLLQADPALGVRLPLLPAELCPGLISGAGFRWS